MQSTQIQEDIRQWEQLYNAIFDGEAPGQKGHWDLRLAFQQFAKHIGGFSKQENENARHLIDKFQNFIDLKRYDKATEMENEIFYFILKTVDKP